MATMSIVYHDMVWGDWVYLLEVVVGRWCYRASISKGQISRSKQKSGIVCQLNFNLVTIFVGNRVSHSESVNLVANYYYKYKEECLHVMITKNLSWVEIWKKSKVARTVLYLLGAKYGVFEYLRNTYMGTHGYSELIGFGKFDKQ